MIDTVTPFEFTYTGKILKEKGAKFQRPPVVFKFSSAEGTVESVEDNSAKPIQESIDPYLPNKDTIDVVRLAQILHRPILLRGEPGCGKTRLAEAVAYEMYGPDFRRYYFEWHIKSTSKAMDGLYTFDHLQRLRDANVKNSTGAEESEENLEKYLELGPLGKAFAVSTAEKPAILLIDEIDKADIDFPNDLLLELDEKRFFIKETRSKEIRAGYPPLIFITSNNEKELPPAFLRRCLYLYIEFPDKDRLLSIITAKFSDPEFLKKKTFLKKAIETFLNLRQSIREAPELSKQVSTSELLDWIAVLFFYFKNNPAEFKKLRLEHLPFSQTLKKGFQEFIQTT